MTDIHKNKNPRAHAPDLRLGVMCNDITQLETWQFNCLKELSALGFVIPALVILDANDKHESILARIRNLGLSRIVFVAVNKYLFRAKARRKADASKILSQAVVLPCQTKP